VTDAAVDARRSDDVLGHPRGMAFLVATEGFERFSYFGMQTLLVLYMTGYLLKPGMIGHVVGFSGFRAVLESVFGRLSDQALATTLFGVYGGSVYAGPILGSLIGDRLGRRRTVTVGLSFMVLGHGLMALEPFFLFALLALLIGSSLLKGNVAAQVASLYAPDDSRLDQAYSIFYMAVNIGGIAAPLVCGTLGEVYGWRYGFGSAGIIMAIGLVIYISGGRYLPPQPTRGARAAGPRLTRADLPRLAGMGVLLITGAAYWSCATQMGDTYMIWLRDRAERGIFGWTVPVTWFSSIDSIAVIALAPAVIALWRWQAARGREPGDLPKVAAGCLIFAATLSLLSIGELVAGPGAKVAVIWPLGYQLLGGVGYLYFAPVIVAWFSRVAPAGATGTAISIYYLSIFAGSVTAGWLSRFYGEVSNAQFWAIQAGIVAGGGVLLLVLRGPLTRVLTPLGGQSLSGFAGPSSSSS